MAGPPPNTRNIAVYARVRPCGSPSDCLAWDTDEHQITIAVPKDASSGLINNTRDQYEFHFDNVLHPDATQDQTFDMVARDVVLQTVQGINGTVFAYGQTGSGKTYTMTGGTARFVDRGIIPRAVALVFGEIASRPDCTYTVHITYLELYNEVGYDLLDASRGYWGPGPQGYGGPQDASLPRVTILEDEQGALHLRNVAMHRVASEEEALQLLFMGDMRRAVSETVLNKASSRSHAIFTMHVQAAKAGESTVRNSKLSLVDLAGSERVGKTGADGQVLREAKSINLSLHYLEQVIVSLQDRAQGTKPNAHVPYRNSLMTLLLRDSLGGNCATAMVATLHPGNAHLEETISTCRFAQRVACVANVVRVNEATDPLLLIAQLRQENRDLRAQLALLRSGATWGGGTWGGAPPHPHRHTPSLGGVTGGREQGGMQGEGDLDEHSQVLGEDEEEKDVVQGKLWVERAVEGYLRDASPSAALDLGGNIHHITAGFALLKQLIVESGILSDMGGLQVQRVDNLVELQAQVQQLQHAVAHKDTELHTLAGMLAAAAAAAQQNATSNNYNNNLSSNNPITAQSNAFSAQSNVFAVQSNVSQDAAPNYTHQQSLLLLKATTHQQSLTSLKTLLQDDRAAFRAFQQQCPLLPVIEENKQQLRTQHNAAKQAATGAAESKARLQTLREQLHKLHVRLYFGGLMEGKQGDTQEKQGDAQEHHPATAALQDAVQQEAHIYEQHCSRLRAAKQQVKTLTTVLEQNRTQLQRDYTIWRNALLGQVAAAEDTAVHDNHVHTHAHMQHHVHSQHLAAMHTAHVHTQQQQQQQQQQQHPGVIHSHPLRSTSDTSQESIGVVPTTSSSTRPPTLSSTVSAAPSTHHQHAQPQLNHGLPTSATTHTPGPPPLSPLQSFSSALSTLSNTSGPPVGPPAPQDTPYTVQNTSQNTYQDTLQDASSTFAQEQHQQHHEQHQQHPPEHNALLQGLPASLQQQVEALLTGDVDIDRDIVRFYRARHAMLSDYQDSW